MRRSVSVPEAGSTTARLPPAIAGSEYCTNSLQCKKKNGVKKKSGEALYRKGNMKMKGRLSASVPEAQKPSDQQLKVKKK